MSAKKSGFAKRHPKLVTAIVVIVVLLIAAAVLLYLIRPDLFNRAVDRLWNEYLE